MKPQSNIFPSRFTLIKVIYGFVIDSDHGRDLINFTIYLNHLNGARQKNGRSRMEMAINFFSHFSMRQKAWKKTRRRCLNSNFLLFISHSSTCSRVFSFLGCWSKKGKVNFNRTRGDLFVLQVWYIEVYNLKIDIGRNKLEDFSSFLLKLEEKGKTFPCNFFSFVYLLLLFFLFSVK